MVAIVIVAAAAGHVLSTLPFVSLFTGGGNSSPPSTAALADIPPDYLTLYQLAAATCPGLDWAVLAAIGKIESDHGRSHLPGVHSGANYAGAMGPMQFLRSTWDAVVARHPPPPGGATPPSPYNPQDAIYTAAAYLCDSGARGNRNLHDAIYAYNHAEWYVNQILAQATAYSEPTSNSSVARASFR